MSFLEKKSARYSYPYEWVDLIAQALLFCGVIVLPLFTLPFTRDTIDLPKTLLFGGIVLSVFLLWFARGVAARELYLRRTSLDLPLATFLFFVAIAAIFSVSPGVAWIGRMGLFVLHGSVAFLLVVSSWLLIQYLRTVDAWSRFLHGFLLSGVLAAVVFFGRGLPGVARVVSWTGGNTVSGLHSVFGIFMAVIGIIGIGLLLERGVRPLRQVIPLLAALSSVAALFRLGFMIAWVIFAVGLFLLVLLGLLFASQTRSAFVSGTFALFLLSLCVIGFGSPSALKLSLPTEVALGAQASWGIGQTAILSGARPFLVGFGPGSYVYVFSKFRPEAFNLVPSLWSHRFYRGYNTPVTFLTEIGVLGSASWIFVILFYGGAIVIAWRHVRERGDGIFAESASARPVAVFVVVAAWVAASIGMVVSFYTFTLWWMWWFLFALGLAGMLFLVPGLLREGTIFLAVSPQYSLAFSFAIIFILSVVVLLSVHAGRLYVGEIAYTRATVTGNALEQRQHLDRALAFSPRSVEYRLALAAWHFSTARLESEKGAAAASAETIASSLSSAVSEARSAAERDPNTVETWEALSLMYLNARAIAADANQWALDATNRALELEPTNPVLHWRLGNIYEFDGNTQEAKQAYERAIRMKADYLASYLSLSELYEKEQNMTAAIDVFAPVLGLLEQNAELLFHIGRLWYNRNTGADLDQAEAAWLRAVELEPNFSNALYSLGLLYERKGERVKAREYFERVRALNPGNPDILQKLRSLQ